MFKVGTPIVYISPKKPKRIYHVLKCHAAQNWLEFGNVALKQKGKQLKSLFRHATPEEIAAGHRIDLEDLRDCDTSPNCKKYDEQVK